MMRESQSEAIGGGGATSSPIRPHRPGFALRRTNPLSSPTKPEGDFPSRGNGEVLPSQFEKRNSRRRLWEGGGELRRAGLPEPLRQVPPSSPVRVQGSPARVRRSNGSSSGKGGHGLSDPRRNVDPASPRRQMAGSQSRFAPRSRARLAEEEDEVEEFWGQLWCIPQNKLKPQPSRARVGRDNRSNLVWVRRDLWRSKQFGVEDCHPVGEGDVWEDKPRKLNFAEVFWGGDQRRSFLQAVKGSMAGRGGGRGPRQDNREEEWGGGGGGGSWNQFPPHPFPPNQGQAPPFFGHPPPPQYGYYPNQVPHPPQFFGDQQRPRGGGRFGAGRGRGGGGTGRHQAGYEREQKKWRRINRQGIIRRTPWM